MRRFFVLVIAVLVVAIAPGRASAHDLKATVKLLPDAIVVEAGYDGDEPAQGAKVVIIDATGKEVATGKTDEKGVCKLPKLVAGKYKAVVDQAGHRDEVEFEVAAEQLEFARERPNQMIGLIAGVGGLLALSVGFWWFRRRKAA